jgi:uncharacterized membrane protein
VVFSPRMRDDTSLASPAKSVSRIASIDALRGVVMIVMALDHVRDFFHAGAMSFSPTDLARTTPALFLTRWITHFCLPVFMFVSGTGAFLFAQRSRTPRLSRFLLTRGLWLIILELTVMQLAYNFTFHIRIVFILILWIFGLCMILMAALVRLPIRWVAGLGIVVVVFHDLLDGVQAKHFGSLAWVWTLLHQPGAIPIGGYRLQAPYPILPWLGVMAAGFSFGQVFALGLPQRRRIMLSIGVTATIAFLLLRAINRYGDPVPWSHQTSAIFTVLSFLNCTKYPASLDFLLMTLGPALLILGALQRIEFAPANPLTVFGRVPLFYFILHFCLIHTLAVTAAWLRYGTAAARFTFTPLPSMGGDRRLFPLDFGYSLWAAWGAWALTVALLYPICLWFAKLKSARRDWWLSYL